MSQIDRIPTFTINGSLTVTGQASLNGLVLLGLGRIGKTVSGDVIDANSDYTYIKARTSGANIVMQVPNGTNVGQFTSGGLDLMNHGIVNVSSLSITGAIGIGGNINIASGQTVNASNLTFNGSGIVFAGGL